MADQGDDHPVVLLTLAEAAQRLDPPISVRTLQRLAAAGRLRQHGTRRRGRGRPAPLFDSAELDRVHAAWVDRCPEATPTDPDVAH